VSHELVAEIAFSGLVAVLVVALVLYVAIAAYRERRAKRSAADLSGQPPAD
jgi:cbb3-type cytochrome oxidase subunit 3